MEEIKKQISDLKQFDEDIKEVSNQMLRKLHHRKVENYAGMDSYRLKYNPELIKSIADFIKVRLDIKKSIIKSYNDLSNIIKNHEQQDEVNVEEIRKIASLVLEEQEKSKNS